MGIFSWFLNLFRSAAEKAWASLSKDLQNHALTASGAVQIIKTNLDATYVDIVNQITIQTGLTNTQVIGFILAVCKDVGITGFSPDKAWDELKKHASDIDTDNRWSAFWQNLMKFGATYLSSGKLDWVSLSLGIAQIAYEKLTKK